MEKSTIQTSRKIYAMRYGIQAVIIFNFVGFFINYLQSGTVQSGTLIAVTASIGGIISTLNIADGMKKGE